MMVRVYANGPGDLGSIPGQVIPKTQWCLMPPCLTLDIIRYGSSVKSSNPGKVVAPSPTPWCSSYRKGSLWVTLDYGDQLNLLTILPSLSLLLLLLLLFDPWEFLTSAFKWWSFTQVWVTISLLKSSWYSGWSPLVLLYPSPPVPLIILLWLYLEHQLQLV